MTVEIETTSFVVIPLEKIVSKLPVRRLSASGLKRIQDSIKRVGFLENYPIIVAPLGDGSYMLIDGNHRYESAKEQRITSVACLVKNGLSESEMYKLAFESNSAAETMVPSTLVTFAEFIWSRLEERDERNKKRYILEDVANILGWKIGAVSNYALLNKLDKRAWEIISTTFETPIRFMEESLVEQNSTTVETEISPFTEGLLRHILDLLPDQQLELVRGLATGEIITKGIFKTRAENYKARNEAKSYAIEKMGDLGEPYTTRLYEEIDKGAYDNDWKKTPDHPKLNKLINALRDEWEEKHSIFFIHGDFNEEVKKIGSESIDLILTDPPYNVARDNEFPYADRTAISLDFGEWDKYGHDDFITLLKAWSQEWGRILRLQGSGYVFISDRYLAHLIDALTLAGLHVRTTIVWHKTNPGTSAQKANFIPSVEFIVFFTKGESGHTFNWQGENEMQNFIEAPTCAGSERLIDAKGDNIHPTQKPERVINHLVEISSNRGDMVFDGFSGVFTTGVVAKKLGRKFIGIEQDEKFFEAGKRRVEEAK